MEITHLKQMFVYLSFPEKSSMHWITCMGNNEDKLRYI